MVDALHQAHALLRSDGEILDVRPDGSRQPRVIRNGRVAGQLLYAPDAREDDASADRAVDRVVALGLFRRVRSGHVWYRYRFQDLAALEAYLRDSGRMAGYSPGTRARLARHAGAPITVRRAIAHQFLRRA
ncbi:MAG: hypothetical protein M3O91_06390 [Chloroflexota bacterium]|nr:hypothetical protein [Chloroflexota bacterium]